MQTHDVQRTRDFGGTTQWSLIEQAKEGDFSALERMVEQYREPLRAYIAAQVQRDDAEDLVQEFLTKKFLRSSFVASVRRGHGSFRRFVKVCVDRFLIDQRDPRRRRPVPGSGPGDVAFDEEYADTLAASEPGATEPAAGEALDRAWYRQLIAQARHRLAEECARARKTHLLDAFWGVVNEDPAAGTHGEIGRRLGLSEGAVSTHFWRFRERFRVLLDEEIRQTTSTVRDWQSERDHFFRLFQGARERSARS